MQLRATRLTAIAHAVRRAIASFSPAALFAANEPGVWYDPSDIVLGWRYNLFTRTEQFDDAGWGKHNATIAADATAAPTGGATADFLVGINATQRHRVEQAVTVLPSTSHSVSVYAKAGGYTVCALREGAVTGAWAQFDLSAGTVRGSGNGGSGTIAPAGNGWFLCTMTMTTQAAQTSYRADVYLLSDAAAAFIDPGSIVWTTDGTSGIYIWGSSLTTAADAAKPYQRITDGIQDYLTYQPQPVMYQDSAGTTPVTAVEQPVGLILDKSRGLVLGPELVTNGDFSAGTAGWNKSAGTTIASGVATLPVGNFLNSAAAGVVGKVYFYTFTIVSTTGSVTPYIVNQATPVRSVAGTYSGIAVGKAVDSIIYLDATSGTTVIDNISVRELPGNHASQTTATSRPVLSARVNLLTKTEQFDDAAWLKTNALVTANAIVSPDGTANADKLIASAGSAQHYALQNISISANGTYTTSFYAKNAEYTSFDVWLLNAATADRAVANFNLTTVTTTNITAGATPFTGQSSTITSVGNGWYRCTLTATSTGVAINLQSRVFPKDSTTYTGDGTSGIYIWGASLVPANQAALPYQRVNTATDYDAGPAFPRYLKLDTVDDVTNTTFASSLGANCTVARAGVGTTPVILTGQTIGTSYAMSTSNAGLVIVNRALTAGETASLTDYLAKKGTP